MSTTVPIRGEDTLKRVRLPLLVYFETDATVKRAIAPIKRYRRACFEDIASAPDDIERIVLVSDEAQMDPSYRALRQPNVRVIALSEAKFKEPRIDGAVYAYLPPEIPTSILERMIDNALDHIQLLANRREMNERLEKATQEIRELSQIGAAMMLEHDTRRLLEMALASMRKITRSDAAWLYMAGEPGAGAPPSSPKTPAKNLLRLVLAQNDSITVPPHERQAELAEESIAGHAALTGISVNVSDAYHLSADIPASFDRKFDEDSGYRTKSVLAVPLRNSKNEVIGVVELVNAKRDFAAKLTGLSSIREQVISFDGRLQALAESIACQAAAALENCRMYASVQHLMGQ